MAIARNASPRRAAETSGAAWRAAIESVLDGNGLELALQPIVDLGRGVTAGYEVLSRFTGPPQATPDVWFAEANRLEMGAALDAVVIERALRLLDEIPPDAFLSINLEPAHLNDERVAAVLRGRSLSRIVLELTEHHRIRDYGSLCADLAPLRDAGAKIAIDDAGNGYAGLQWLMALSPNLIKFDRALIDGIDGDEVKLAMVTLLGDFADRIDAWVLAEGVERHAELDTIMRLGIPLAQGYLLARPSLERWPDLVPAIGEHIRRRRANDEGSATLGRLIETVPLRGSDGLSHAGGDVVVTVDAFGRPLSVDLHDRSGCPPLVVRPGDRPADALARAVTRPPHWRWVPIVCVTETRQVLGVVRIERLIEHVLGMAHSHDDDGHEVMLPALA